MPMRTGYLMIVLMLDPFHRILALIGCIYSFYGFSLFLMDLVHSLESRRMVFESQNELAWCFFGGLLCFAVLLRRSIKYRLALICVMYFYLSLNLVTFWLL